jgi:4-hydroxyphenylpyruvate dioxygenase
MHAQTSATTPNLGMQVTTFDNPMGIDGFEFVEFAAPQGQGDLLRDQFTRMGFTAVLQHRTRPITLYRQGGVNFLVNEDPDSFAADFAKAHGPSACGFAIRFRKPADEVCRTVLGNGGEAIDHKPETKAVDAPVVKGIGDCMLYLVDRYGDAGSMYDDYLPVQGADQHPTGFGLTFIDHLTHNLYFGNMQKWSDYYERLFNFREIRYFDIKGAKTGLVSKAMTAPDGVVRIRSTRAVIPSRRSMNTSTPTTARASSTSPASPTTSMTRSRPCARRASSSWIRRTPTSTWSTSASRTTARTSRAWRRTRS